MLRFQSTKEFNDYTGNIYRDMEPYGGVLYLKSNVVDSKEYLQALWRNIGERCDAAWERRVVHSMDLKQLSTRHDHIIIAAGPNIHELWKNSMFTEDEVQVKWGKSPKLFRFKYVGGQSFSLRHEDICSQVRAPVLLGSYMLPSIDGKSVLCGSTHEHVEENELGSWDADVGHAKDIIGTSFKQHGLWPRYFPPLESLNVQDLATSIRVVAPRCRHGRIPRAARHRLHDNVWMLAGLGSKGLIHHAVVAEAVIGAVIRNDANALPNEMKILYG
jgi:glycine/D-amino acid oxidase-like deaminating enzyme